VRKDCDVLAVSKVITKAAYQLAHCLEFTIPSFGPLASRLAHGQPYHRHVVYSPVISVNQYDSFESWMNKKSGSFRKGLRYDRKQLCRTATINLLHNDQDISTNLRIIRWMFTEKRNWLARKNKRAPWIQNDYGQNIMEELANSQLLSSSGVELWALLVEGTPAAAAICFDSPASVELFMFVMNPLFAARSPGSLLLEDIARFAFERSKYLDFRITNEPYKMRWADAYLPYTTYVIATSYRGMLPLVRSELHMRKVQFRKWGKKQFVSFRTQMGTWLSAVSRRHRG
jgi:CelD/BcsL family acetyltransferase involved in cellulose biosynthesis